MRRLYRSISGIHAKDTIITRSTRLKSKPAKNAPIPFGQVTTDYMLEIDWDTTRGWHPPHIKPYQPLQLSPCTSALHYGTAVFDGFKVYRDAQGQPRMFRPMMNMERLSKSCRTVGLPDFDKAELLSTIKKFLVLDQDWVPSEHGYSLYVRPFAIGTSTRLRFSQPVQAKIVVIACPVASYFAGGFEPVGLYCDDKAVRAWPGGHANAKLAANYATIIPYMEVARNNNCQQMLWLTDQEVTEVGMMNFFLRWINKAGEDELITSPLDELILPGVTRDSILELCRSWGHPKATVRKFSIEEVVEALKENRVIEAFGAGTASVICPVSKLQYAGQEYAVPLAEGNIGSLSKKLWDTLLAIQYGEVKHEWSELLSNN